MGRKKKKQKEWRLKFEGLDKEVIIGGIAEIKVSDPDCKFIHFDMMKDGRWKMFFTTSAMTGEDFEGFTGLTLEEIKNKEDL